MDDQEIINYYEYTRRFYKHLWHGVTGGIHYGFWDENTKNHEEALLNTNKTLADIAKITSADMVLDAGCGVGGSALWLAEHIGCHAHGITLSPGQVRTANETARRCTLHNLARFSQQDFLHTNFANETFDVVWAIESVCHAKNKAEFLREAYRVLKPGGRIVISDGFLLRAPQTHGEELHLEHFLRGWALANLATKDGFERDLATTGFADISLFSKAKEVWPEVVRIRHMTLWGYPLAKMTEFFHLTSPILTKNNLGGLAQYELVTRGIMGHVIFLAHKKEA